MILNRNFYNKVSRFRAWWYRKQMQKLQGPGIFKAFKLHKTEWPNRLYYYSPRLKRIPQFVGTAENLSRWQGSKGCETICPTQAIKVTASAIIIDDRGCISCGLCVEYAPEGILEMPTDLITLHRS
jgi:ferredoxin